MVFDRLNKKDELNLMKIISTRLVMPVSNLNLVGVVLVVSVGKLSRPLVWCRVWQKYYVEFETCCYSFRTIQCTVCAEMLSCNQILKLIIWKVEKQLWEVLMVFFCVNRPKELRKLSMWTCSALEKPVSGIQEMV